MAISYPLTLPTTPAFRQITFIAKSAIGISQSPFSLVTQATVHQGEMWEVEVELPPMHRTAAEAWIAFLMALNGMEGSFLLGDPVGQTPQGGWNGAEKVSGADQTGRSLNIKDGTEFATLTAGDWVQLGSGSSSTLHKLLQDVTVDSGGEATIDLWPQVRVAPSDSAVVTTSSAKGLFRLSENTRSWNIQVANLYGISFRAMEYL